MLIPDWPAPPGVRALQTLRHGGTSPAPWASFNLGIHVGDDPVRVERHRAKLADQLPGSPVWLEQVHGITVVDAAQFGQSVPRADAIFTTRTGLVCPVMTADCLPVLLCDRRASVVAAVHCGWRGLADGILEATVDRLGVAPKELMAWLGPAIGPQAFEVGDEVRQLFVDRNPRAATAFEHVRAGKWLADLYGLARLKLADLGISSIHGGGFCTFSDSQRFFSYRRDGQTGRMATLIWLDAASRRV